MSKQNPSDEQRIDAANERYIAALHAMQSGVRFDQEAGSDDGSAKHLRVGINSALVSNAALVKTLVDAGLITMADYLEALADEMEHEVATYKQRLQARYGLKVDLL